MNLLKFIFFSSLEYFGTFMFVLVQFRFSVKENISKIVLISLLLSFVSYSLRLNELNSISPLIQNLIFLMYIQMVMKVNIIHTIIMVLTGYIVFGLVQTCIIAVALHLDFIDLNNFEPASTYANIIQFLSFVVMTVFSLLTLKFKGGFSFIEARSRFSRKIFSGKNKWFLLLIFLSFIVTIISNIILIESENPPFLLIASIMMIILLVHTYMTLRKDESND
ncbi:hypothetical protein [Cohnella sp. GCM10027633]|uniref:hypothetical protein n=1 Tax=unclassified Cohnella TaxID=2636738 RepID=UPI003636C24D